MSSTDKRVVWDESNLNDNAEWQAANPVTMKIDEPKTPYEPDRAMDEEGNFVDSDDEHHKSKVNPGSSTAAENPEWDENTRDFARRARAEAPVVHTPTYDANQGATDFKKGGLSLDTSAPANDSHAEEQHKAEFQHMRKAVYADEGAKFKAMLANAKNLEDEEDEE
eukprot:TRINITY_DN29801_c0_g1_i1.p1 TRINITY_DN29801_c0_g1~~TRINITY_DN29801_c0_g1_i1.p1  ORF type:complete len:166 (+),score=48.06 TRINITY_DN29801_c0_g1_i1:164-661(+)